MTKETERYETEFVKIIILEDPFESQIVAAALEDEGIPHLIRSYHDTAYDGLYQAQKGWGEVRAPAAYRDQIVHLVTDVRTHEQESTDDEYDDEDTDR